MSSIHRVRPMPEYPRSEKKRKRTSATRTGYGFLPGNIVEIEVHNFMTYSHLKSRPGARLNLVVGPNGTGKSSLVCAIGIGLGGDPSLLGRAASVGDFVKRGEDSGWIRITLQGRRSGDFTSITCILNKPNKCTWVLKETNVSRPASKKDVKEVVSKYNIQVHNLTQFLPQDKVTEFAKMTPIELLEETEKAVGDPELSDQHQALIAKSADLKRMKMTMTQRESVLARLRANNADLEKDMQRLQERKSLMEKAENLKKKLPWLRYEQKKAQYQILKDKEKESKQRLIKAAEKINTLKRPVEALIKKRIKIETAARKKQQVHDQLESLRQTLIENESKMGEQVRGKLKEIAEVHKRESLRDERIATASKDIASAEAELADLPEYVPPKDEIQELGIQIREFELRMAEKRNQIAEKEQTRYQKRQQREQVVRRIAEVESIKNRLLQALKDSGARGIGDAYKWVESHRTEFRKDVYGPVLLEVNVADKEHAKYLENHVPNYIWKAFVSQDDRDRDHLQRNLKIFDAVVINARESRARNAPSLTHQMKEIGIVSRLDEVVSAPPIIKHVLNGQAHLDHSFIGSSQSDALADQAYALGVSDLWTPENHYRWNRSLYGSQVSASVTAVRAARLFSQNVDARLRNELEGQKEGYEKEIVQTEEETRNLKNDLRVLEEEAATLHRQRENILNTMKMERKKRDDKISRIEQRKRRLESLKMEERSKTTEERLRAEISKLNLERKTNVLTLKGLAKDFAKNHIKLVIKQLTLAERDVQINDLQRKIKGEEQLTSEAQRRYDDSKMEKRRFRDLLGKARQDLEGLGTIPNELQIQFREMPDTVEDLEAAIDDALAEANAVLCNNPGVLDEYERRCKQIERLEIERDTGRAELEACFSETKSIKVKWLSTLRSLVAKINEVFGQTFSEMAVAGEVSLDEHDTDFDQYGILIKVKFRETGELQVLSASHQSGGERSVTTILYLVSLQDLTHCPFRVVDEINQGMDPQNERKMFQQLVKAASQLNTPQCFLLTPKLLPNLKCTEACTILNVMNGPYIDEAAESKHHKTSHIYFSQTMSNAVEYYHCHYAASHKSTFVKRLWGGVTLGWGGPSENSICSQGIEITVF